MPGEFLEKRIDNSVSEIVVYNCKKCGAEVLWFSPVLGKVVDVAEQVCSKCFLESAIFKEE